MAASLVGGAAVGAVFGELLKAVLEMKDKAAMFKPTLAYLGTTLIAIDPVIKEIEQHNNELGRPKDELKSLIKQMEEGTRLVYKCSKINSLNICARLRYQEQLLALVESLVRFFMIDMQAQIARDLKETLLKVKRMHSAINKLPVVSTENTVGSSSDSVPLPVDLSQIEIFESTAMQPNEENAMETDSIEEIVELETLPSTSAKGAAGNNSATQVMEDITKLSQKTEANVENSQVVNSLMREKSYDQSYANENRFICTRLSKIKLILHKIRGFNSQIRKNPFEPRKIIALEGCPHNFDLEDLLSASLDVLGTTSHGFTYKAILKDGTTLVMKRLRGAGVEMIEFERKLKIVQMLSQHPNVMPLLACYYSEDEKLLFYDYMATGSFPMLLQGRKGARRTPLDCNSRMKIALGVAKGIAHIHSASEGEFVHGNIRSSNVLITADLQGRVSDLAITSALSASFDLFGKIGYKAPELIKTKTLTQKSDVYSFGVLLFEMLTGKLPRNGRFVLFDYSIRDYMGGTQRQMMQLAHACVAKDPDLRPSMDEVVRKMEEVKASKSN